MGVSEAGLSSGIHRSYFPDDGRVTFDGAGSSGFVYVIELISDLTILGAILV